MDQNIYSLFHSKRLRSGKSDNQDRSKFRILLTEKEVDLPAYIYFIQPYVGLPKELSKSGGNLILFSFEYLQMATEHKDILFHYPFLVTDYQYYRFKLNQQLFEQFTVIFRCIATECRRNDIQAPKIVVSYLNILFQICSRLQKADSMKKGKHHYTSLLIVSKFRQLIYKFGKQERNVSFYANELNLTPNYLNIVLKSVTQKNASTHIYDFIMNEAKYLLIHTKLSLKEVASELGFVDQSYFTRFFKKQSGVNPLEWFNVNL